MKKITKPFLIIFASLSLIACSFSNGGSMESISYFDSENIESFESEETIESIESEQPSEESSEVEPSEDVPSEEPSEEEPSEESIESSETPIESEEPTESESSSSEESSETEEDEDKIEWIGNDPYPYYSTPSTRFAMSLEAGWNLGNSLDSHSDTVDEAQSYIDLNETLQAGISELDLELCYGNPKISYGLLRTVKQSGYTTIRIPVSWHQHVVKNNNFKISDTWMYRVKEVVDQALGLGFKVILNTHHDIDPSFIYPDYAHIDNSIRFIQSIWTQISKVFGGYNTNLIYEGFNEPRLSKNNDSFNTELNTEEVRNCIDRYNQVFVDTIRASSLKTEQKRFLIVKAYADSPYVITYAHAPTFSLPNDPSNRLIVSVHIYSPTELAFKGTGGFDASNDEDTSHIKWILDGLYQQFVLNGVGVIVGEWGTVATSSNLNVRIEHANFFMEQTYLRHIPSVYWDNGNLEGEAFALFNRTTETVVYREINEAINSHWTIPGKTFDINYYGNNKLIYTETVKEGKNAIGPSLPWGYGFDNMYLDINYTNLFNINSSITSNLNVYLKNYSVRPTSTCDADNDWGPIEDKYFYISNGEWHCTAPGKGKTNNYETQINFDLPTLFTSTSYRISFAYQISGPNAISLVYNDDTAKTVGNVISMNDDSAWHYVDIDFNSNDVTNGETRFTFSLSSIPSSCYSMNFGIKDLTIKTIA